MGRVKSELKEVVDEARGSSSFSWPRIIATALAAVTMAVLSTRLSSIFGALMLTAVISIGSALAAEFYRVVITVTTESTKKVIVPAILDQESDEADTASEAPSSKPTDAQEPDVLDAAQETTSDQSVAELSHAVKQVAKGSARSNQMVMLSLIFGLVSLLTIGISYGVAKAQGGDIYNTTVETHPVQQLDDEQVNALVELATQASKEGVPDYQSLINSLTALQEENKSLTQTVEDLRTEQSSSLTEIQRLQTEIDELTTKIQDLTGDEETPTTPTEPTNPSTSGTDGG